MPNNKKNMLHEIRRLLASVRAQHKKLPWLHVAKVDASIRQLLRDTDIDAIREQRLVVQEDLLFMALNTRGAWRALGKRPHAIPVWVRIGQQRKDGLGLEQSLAVFFQQMSLPAHAPYRRAMEMLSNQAWRIHRARYTRWLLLRRREERARRAEPAKIKELRQWRRVLREIDAVAN